MILAAAVSAGHVLALALGLPSVFLRARALGATEWNEPALQRVLRADNVWGIASLLWIATGLARFLGGLDKATSFYLYSGMFWVKMSLFGLVFLLELAPMITFIRWRIALGKKNAPDVSRVSLFRTISFLQTGIVACMVFVAALMVRGMWLLGGAP